jgi:hypothetical protein
MLARRIAFFALDGGPHVSLSDEALAWLWNRFGNDARGPEQALYEVFQQIEEPGVISASALAAFLS